MSRNTYKWNVTNTTRHHGTCRAIVSSSLMQVADYGHPTRSPLLCHGPQLFWVTDHLLLPDHKYGTVCRQICA